MKTLLKLFFILPLVLAAVLLSACQTPPLIHPVGFAVYEDKTNSYKSISPERIMYRVRAHDNEDNADLAFWKTALKTHLKDSGYIQLAESEIRAGTTAAPTTGNLLTLASPLGAKDYTYLIAIFINKNKLLVFESAGETKYFGSHKDNIIKTIKNTNLDSAAQL